MDNGKNKERLTRHNHKHDDEVNENSNSVIDDEPAFLVDIPESVCSYREYSAVSQNSSSSLTVHERRKVVFPHKLKGDVHSGMLFDEKRRIIMDWTPKSACTKAVEMFWNEMKIWRGVYYPTKAFVHAYRIAFYLRCGTVSQAMLDDPSYYKFKVVRNPYFRAVSSYLHIMKNRLVDMMFDKAKLSRDTGVKSLRDVSFEQFLILYMEQVHGKTLKNSAIQHFSPQSSSVEFMQYNIRKKDTNRKPLFNRIVHIENFDEEIAMVNADVKTNYSYPDGVDKHVVKKQLHADIYHGNWSYSELAKNGVPENYGKFYGRKNKKIVQVIFRNDFLLYNYSFPFDRIYT